jgi:hypothetical protein
MIVEATVTFRPASVLASVFRTGPCQLEGTNSLASKDSYWERVQLL